MPGFLVLVFICIWFTFMSAMPNVVATLRAVEPIHRSLGLGIESIILRYLNLLTYLLYTYQVQSKTFFPLFKVKKSLKNFILFSIPQKRTNEKKFPNSALASKKWQNQRISIIKGFYFSDSPTSQKLEQKLGKIFLEELNNLLIFLDLSKAFENERIREIIRLFFGACNFGLEIDFPFRLG